MFNSKKKSKEEIIKTKEAAWGYFKSDQLGPKNYKSVDEVYKAMLSSEKVPPLVCWADGKISSGEGVIEVWLNDGDTIRKIPGREGMDIDFDKEPKLPKNLPTID